MVGCTGTVFPDASVKTGQIVHRQPPRRLSRRASSKAQCGLCAWSCRIQPSARCDTSLSSAKGAAATLWKMKSGVYWTGKEGLRNGGRGRRVWEWGETLNKEQNIRTDRCVGAGRNLSAQNLRWIIGSFIFSSNASAIMCWPPNDRSHQVCFVCRCKAYDRDNVSSCE